MSEYNKIKRLQDEMREWKDTEEEIQGVITGYFDDMFQTRGTGEQLSGSVKFNCISKEQS